MLSVERITWVGEPSAPKMKRGHWPQYTIWDFKAKDTAREWEGVMGVEDHDIYLAEVEVLKIVDVLKLSPKLRRALLDTVETYGDARNDKGFRDARDDGE